MVISLQFVFMYQRFVPSNCLSCLFEICNVYRVWVLIVLHWKTVKMSHLPSDIALILISMTLLCKSLQILLLILLRSQFVYVGFHNMLFCNEWWLLKAVLLSTTTSWCTEWGPWWTLCNHGALQWMTCTCPKKTVNLKFTPYATWTPCEFSIRV